MKEIKKISIINYIPRLSLGGKPRGHYVKTIKEYVELLDENFIVEVVSEEKTALFLNIPNIKKINNILNEEPYYQGNFFKKLNLLFKTSVNIFKCLFIADGDLIIFFSPDPAFYLIFPLLKLFFLNKKFAINIYQDRSKEYPTKIIKAMTKFVYTHINLIFTSLKNFKYTNSFFLPDFIYNKKKYTVKEDDIKDSYYLCIGSIAIYEKNYDELINVFKNSSKKLLIAGPVTELKEKDFLCKLINGSKNIDLQLTFLSDKKYKKLIKNAKAVILPYKEEYYKGRSSGVLLESIFLNKPVITPFFLLKVNHVNGYGYNSADELEKIISQDNLTPKDNSELLEKYNFEIIKRQLREKILKI